MTKKLLIIILGLFLMNYTNAQKKNKLIQAHGKHQELIDDSHCIGDIRKKVEDFAKINAIEQVFGRVVIQGTNTYLENINTGEKIETKSQMNSIANSLVRGEWIKTDKITTSWVIKTVNNTQELWLNCEIWGKAREVQEAKVDFMVKTLKCTELLTCATEKFQENDDLFLYFKTPVKGYLSVFMEENGVIYRLFPYRKVVEEYESSVPVEADKEYFLFSVNKGKTYFKNYTLREIDEYTLETGSKDLLFNRLYIVFSKKTFKKPVLKESNSLMQTSPKKFQAWVSQNKSFNKDFQIKNIDIVIKK